MTTPLPDLLRRHSDASMDWVERVIFGTTDADQMATVIGRTVDDLLGVAVDGGISMEPQRAACGAYTSPMAGRSS